MTHIAGFEEQLNVTEHDTVAWRVKKQNCFTASSSVNPYEKVVIISNAGAVKCLRKRVPAFKFFNQPFSFRIGKKMSIA